MAGTPSTISSFKHLLPHLTPHRGLLAGMVALLLAGSLVSLAHPWMAGLLTASVLGQQNVSIELILALWVLVIAVRSLLGFLTTYRIGSTGQQMTADLRNRLYQHMQALPVAYFERRRAGDTLTLLSADAAIISNFVTDTLVQLLPATLTLVGAFLLMVWLDAGIAILCILFLPFYVIVMKIMGRKLRPLSKAWVGANSQMVSVVQENLSMLPAIKSFTREGHEQARFNRANSQLLGLSRQQLRVQAMLSPTIALLGGLGLIALLWMGSTRIESGQLAPAQMVSLLLYAVLLISPLRTFANVYGQIQRTLGSAGRIVEFFGEQPEPKDDSGRPLAQPSGHIQFENVSFSYPGRPRVLDGFTLAIEPGETVAITGPNGVGKTTCAHLLMRLIDPDKGRITIDGNDIREVTLSSLRSNIGLVAQNVLLLNATVAENIAYGRPDAAPEEIERAARSAHAHQFIGELPRGYDTVIGDQGVRLSGGQRQRISLARTLLKDPPILILDEATAMFDPEGEKTFVDQYQTSLQKKTVILITHRPASLALADRVIQLGHGTPLNRSNKDNSD